MTGLPCPRPPTPHTLEPTITATTPINTFVETAALYAVMCEDRDRAIELVLSMHPSERAHLAHQLDELRTLLTDRFGNDIEEAFKQ